MARISEHRSNPIYADPYANRTRFFDNRDYRRPDMQLHQRSGLNGQFNPHQIGVTEMTGPGPQTAAAGKHDHRYVFQRAPQPPFPSVFTSRPPGPRAPLPPDHYYFSYAPRIGYSDAEHLRREKLSQLLQVPFDSPLLRPENLHLFGREASEWTETRLCGSPPPDPGPNPHDAAPTEDKSNDQRSPVTPAPETTTPANTAINPPDSTKAHSPAPAQPVKIAPRDPPTSPTPSQEGDSEADSRPRLVDTPPATPTPLQQELAAPPASSPELDQAELADQGRDRDQHPEPPLRGFRRTGEDLPANRPIATPPAPAATAPSSRPRPAQDQPLDQAQRRRIADARPAPRRRTAPRSQPVPVAHPAEADPSEEATQQLANPPVLHTQQVYALLDLLEDQLNSFEQVLDKSDEQMPIIDATQARGKPGQEKKDTRDALMAHDCDEHGRDKAFFLKREESFAFNVPAVSSSGFEGACLDTGASRTIIGVRQALALRKPLGHRLPLYQSNMRVRFGSGCAKSVGKIVVPVELGNQVVLIAADVVRNDVPFLVGMDTFDRHRLTPDVIDNVILHKPSGRRYQCHRKNGHLYLEWNVRGNKEVAAEAASADQVFYTRAELLKIHKHFFHPAPRRLYDMLLRADPQNTPPETLRTLQDIAEGCRVCQTFKPRPLSFKVALPRSDLRFNSEVGLDLMWLEDHDRKRAVLHVVDIDTGFSNAVFLQGQTVTDVWRAFLECWSTTYIGHPSAMRIDQGTQFTADKWTARTAAAGIVLKQTGVESHNSMGQGERYHAPLRRIYNKVRATDPKLTAPMALRLAIKAMNDTMGPDGLVPTLLVFGTMPTLPASSTTSPAQDDRLRALEVARREYEGIVAEKRLKEALRSRVPAAATIAIEIGDRMMVHREADGYQHGPYEVKQIEGKVITLDVKGRLAQFNRAQLVPAEPQPSPQPDAVINFIRDALIEEYGTQPDAAETEILLTETLSENDPRRGLKMFRKAIATELTGLMKRGTWTVVHRSQIRRGANIVGNKYVLTIKDADTPAARAKARLVATGNNDKDKYHLIHDSKTVRPSSIRILLIVTTQFGWRLSSTDVDQAYLQSETEFDRVVYMRPPRELNLHRDQLLRLIRPLYGLPDAGDHWYHTFAIFLRDGLKLSTVPGDASLHFKARDGRTDGLVATYVDDTLIAGSKHFYKLTDEIGKRFESKKPEYDSITFAGVDISTVDAGFETRQARAASQIRPLPTEADYTDLKSRMMEVAWLTHTRPDLAYQVAALAQTTTTMFEADRGKYIRWMNKVAKYVAQTIKRGLNYRKLDQASLHIRVYSDGSFANNPDGTSQLGYVILLADDKGCCNVLAFRSFKCRRRVRSVLGSETLALVDAFDQAFLIREQLAALLGRALPIRMLTDSKTLFDVLTRGTLTTERRLVIDLMAARDAYRNGEISDVGHVRSEFNIADELTKPTDGSRLRRVMATNRIRHPVEEWVVRSAEAIANANEMEANRLASERSRSAPTTVPSIAKLEKQREDEDNPAVRYHLNPANSGPTMNSDSQHAHAQQQGHEQGNEPGDDDGDAQQVPETHHDNDEEDDQLHDGQSTQQLGTNQQREAEVHHAEGHGDDEDHQLALALEQDETNGEPPTSVCDLAPIGLRLLTALSGADAGTEGRNEEEESRQPEDGMDWMLTTASQEHATGPTTQPVKAEPAARPKPRYVVDLRTEPMPLHEVETNYATDGQDDDEDGQEGGAELTDEELEAQQDWTDWVDSSQIRAAAADSRWDRATTADSRWDRAAPADAHQGCTAPADPGQDSRWHEERSRHATKKNQPKNRDVRMGTADRVRWTNSGRALDHAGHRRPSLQAFSEPRSENEDVDSVDVSAHQVCATKPQNWTAEPGDCVTPRASRRRQGTGWQRTASSRSPPSSTVDAAAR